MKVTIDEVKYIGKLAKLNFSDEEAEKFADEKKELKPIVRKDEVKKFECTDLFRNVKDKQDTYIRVPKIIE